MKALTTTQKKRTAILCAIALVVLVGIALLAISCSAESGGGIESVGAAAGNVEAEQRPAEGMMDAGSASGEGEPPAESYGATAAGGEGVLSTADSDQAPLQEAGHPSGEASKPSASGNGGASEAAPSKRWVEDTQEVWIEDRAAWTEQVPVYSTKEVSICNVCGQDITVSTSAHAKAHMMAGEGSGHHSEVRKEIAGYETVNHPAEGHYETRVVGGHWE